MSGTIFLSYPKDEVARHGIFGRDFFEAPVGWVGFETVAVACTVLGIVERGCCVDARHRLPSTAGKILTAASI